MKEMIFGRDHADMNRLAAKMFVRLAEDSVEKRGRFTAALSGGSTPKTFFRLLASEPYRSQVDWTRAVFFFSDERNVPPDADESNFRMANENLFEPLGIKDSHIFRWQTELGHPEIVAREYEKSLIAQFGRDLPVFDLILLGMGQDGHTASLFPGTIGLDETERYAISNTVPQLQTTRLTLTFPVLNAARTVAFLVAGADKPQTLAAVLEGNAEFHEIPSRAIDPYPGDLLWFTDPAAAAALNL